LFSLFGASVGSDASHGAIGKKCVVRTYASGVHFGEVVAVFKNEGRSRCELKDSRRIWKWGGNALSLSEVSQIGIDPEQSRLSIKVPQHFVEDVIEFLPTSSVAAQILGETKAYDTK
jgi:hypothetical protein